MNSCQHGLLLMAVQQSVRNYSDSSSENGADQTHGSTCPFDSSPMKWMAQSQGSRIEWFTERKIEKTACYSGWNWMTKRRVEIPGKMFNISEILNMFPGKQSASLTYCFWIFWSPVRILVITIILQSRCSTSHHSSIWFRKSNLASYSFQCVFT